MKILTFFLLIFFTCEVLSAQEDVLDNKILIGYYGSFAYQSGLKIGLEMPLKATESEKKIIYSFVQINAGFYIKKNFNTNWVLGGEYGWNFQKKEKKRYQQLSAGLNYLMQSEITSLTINLAGEVVKKERERQDYLLLILGYEFGGTIGQRFNWFTKVAPGYRISIKHPSAITLFLELGLNTS